MKNKIIYLLILIGIIGFTSGCEKDGEIVKMLTDPIAPSISVMPDLTLQRTNGTDTLEIIGTSVDPGFVASATYFLEACPAGDNFQNIVQLYSGVQDTLIKISVSDMNAMLLDLFPADETSSVDFRIRSILTVDAGTGDDPMEYISESVNAEVTLYGLPSLNLLNSGMTQKIESLLGNGEYSGFVKLAVANPFTLSDPDSGKEYGGSGGVLEENGAAIVPSADGWHILTANTVDLTYDIQPYMIGVVGSATPNGWNTPDQKMDYDFDTKTWNITLDLTADEIKFRLNDGWAWNLGLADGSDTDLVHDGANIPIPEAGNYTIVLSVSDYDNEIATFTMTKNN